MFVKSSLYLIVVAMQKFYLGCKFVTLLMPNV